MAEGSMGGAPRGGGGSMTPAGFTDDIRRKKEMDALDELSGKQERVEEEKADIKEQERVKEIDNLLPELVISAYGEIPYTTFREIYKDVYDGVEAKDHYAVGYLVHNTELPGGGKLSVRTFRRHEADALRSITPRRSAFDGGTVESFHTENRKWVSTKIGVGLLTFDDRDMEISTPLNIGEITPWLDSEEVKSKLDFVDKLPDEIVAFVDAVINDTMYAYRTAATENLKNRLAPLSPSTD